MALWLSGLRLSEALSLSWEDGDVQIQERGEHFVVVFQPEGQKSGRHEQMPATPDFAEVLSAIPREKRRGKLFNIVNDDGKATLVAWVGRMITRMGKRAGIVVNESANKYASAHDLRRSFGTRWAAKNIPIASLKRIMRHASIETTLKYYVALDAETLAEELKKAAT